MSGDSPSERARDERFVTPEQESTSVIDAVTHDTEENDNPSPLKRQLDTITVKQPAILTFTDPANVEAYLQEHPVEQQYDVSIELTKGFLAVKEGAEAVIESIYGTVHTKRLWESAGVDYNEAKDTWEEARRIAETQRKTRLDAEAAARAVVKEWGPLGEAIVDMNKHHWPLRHLRKAAKKMTVEDFANAANRAIVNRLNRTGYGRRGDVKLMTSNII